MAELTAGLGLLQLLRLASPGLPIGGFSYSQGMETALDLGWVTDKDSARQWLSGLVAGPLSQFEAALLARACRACAAGDEMALVELNQQFLASRESRELRMETEQMGYSFRQLLHSLPEAEGYCWPVALASGPVALPVVWAIAGHILAIPLVSTVYGYLWTWLENQIMVLLKAMPMGQTHGQQLMSALLPELEQAANTASVLPESELSNFAPGLALAAMKHETQYSRLFRS